MEKSSADANASNYDFCAWDVRCCAALISYVQVGYHLVHHTSFPCVGGHLLMQCYLFSCVGLP